MHTLWTAFARFYERHKDLENARVIFEKATQARRLQCMILHGLQTPGGLVLSLGQGRYAGVFPAHV